MYFPYLRGKQFDLIAIRELSDLIGESEVIHPVIEAVRESSTLRITLEQLVESEVPFTLIINPKVGDFESEHHSLIQLINQVVDGYEQCYIGLLINSNTDLDYLDRLLGELEEDYAKVLIHRGRFHDLQLLQSFVAGKQIAYNFFKEGLPRRRYRRIVDNQTKVILSDKFNAQRVNADYAEVTDEFFTDEHNYYAEDGFAGFSDYTTIGNDYSDSGFAPYAVAIHLTYLKEEDQIWIRHFVSDSNEDYSDVAGKYSEALDKLIKFIDQRGTDTIAADKFREHYENGHYPGLGSVKKLSIQHHIELLISILR